MYYAERIRLRRADPALDTEDRYRWTNDPETVRHLGMRPQRMTREDVRKYLELASTGTELVEFAIETLDGRPIGGACLRSFNHIARSADYGILIGEADFRGRGYGTEVTRLMVQIGFEEFNLNRITLSVNADNPAGIRAYEKAGFVKEGLMRQKIFVNGKYRDSYSMAILREDYDRRKGSQTDGSR